jgi:glyoxylase-like metal-dependent hydrolase (beta-lactamase superfamily II)
MIFRQLFDQESSTYSYLLGDPITRKAVLIDSVISQADLYVQLLQELSLELDVAIDTHTHADHITALGKLRDMTGCRTMVGEQSHADCASGKFKDGDQIQFGQLSLVAIYTPGHTDDSYSFLLADPKAPMVFTGDTLLIRGTGRTDFQNGDALDQYTSIFDKLMQLPETTLVYPAHDYKGWMVSSIAEERDHNPRLQVSNAAEYAELMAGLDLPNPRLMDVAVPANQACGSLAAG